MLNRGNSSRQYGKEKTHSPWRHPQGLAAAGSQSHSRPDSRQTATPCNLFSLICIYDHRQHTNNYSIRHTNLYEFSKWKWASPSSWLKQGYGKIAKNYTWFTASTTTFSFGTLIVPCCFLTYIKAQRLCRIHACLVTSSFKSQYHLESALTLHLDRHNTMYDSILHTNSLIHASRQTRVLTANAFSLRARPHLPKAQN